MAAGRERARAMRRAAWRVVETTLLTFNVVSNGASVHRLLFTDSIRNNIVETIVSSSPGKLSSSLATLFEQSGLSLVGSMEVVWCLYEGCMVVLKVNFLTCARYSSTGARVTIQEPARAGNRRY